MQKYLNIYLEVANKHPYAILVGIAAAFILYYIATLGFNYGRGLA